MQQALHKNIDLDMELEPKASAHETAASCVECMNVEYFFVGSTCKMSQKLGK
jgi:hypothetical protein